jgi:hypothetical protein
MVRSRLLLSGIFVTLGVVLAGVRRLPCTPVTTPAAILLEPASTIAATLALGTWVHGAGVAIVSALTIGGPVIS